MAYSTVYICIFVDISSMSALYVVATHIEPSGASISVCGGHGSHLFSQYSPALFEFLISARLQIAEKHKT